MTLKDFIRILKRRIVWFLAVFVIGMAIYGYAKYTEKTFYTSSAVVKIESPEPIALITQAPQRIYTPPATYATWQALITRKDVKARSLEKLKAKYPDIDKGILDGLRYDPVSGTLLTNISITTTDGNLSTQAVNIAAQESADTSKSIATADLATALQNLNKIVEENEKSLAVFTEQRTQLQKKAGVVNIDKRVDEIYGTLGGLSSEIRTIENNIKRNSLLLEKLNKDKIAASHLASQGVTTTSKAYRVAAPTSPAIDALENKILELRFSLNEQSKRYTQESSVIKSLKSQVKENERRLTEEREKIMGYYMDKEELRLVNEIELSTLEKRSLEQALDERQKEYNTISDIYREYDLVNRQYSELYNRNVNLANLREQILTKKEAQSGYITIHQAAEVEDVRIAEKKAEKILPMALLLSLVSALGAVYIAELLDTTIKTDYDVRRHLNYQLLGIVPLLKKEDVILLKGKEVSVIYELFDTMVTMINSLRMEKPIKSILITSTNPEEGKTCIAINLSTAIARQGKKVILIDSDLRIPTIHSFLSLDNEIGFSELLVGTSKITDAASFEEISKEAGLEGLKVITSGKSTDNPYAILEPQKVAGVIDAVKQFSDYIVIDSPPVLRTGDALKLASVADAVILIVEGGRTDQKEATWAKHLIENVGATILGVVLNKAAAASEQYYYYYYYSGSYGKYYRTGV